MVEGDRRKGDCRSGCHLSLGKGGWAEEKWGWGRDTEEAGYTKMGTDNRNGSRNGQKEEVEEINLGRGQRHVQE